MLSEKTMIGLEEGGKTALFLCPEEKQELTKEELEKLIGMLSAAHELMD
jgi:hypothetical protein